MKKVGPTIIEYKISEESCHKCIYFGIKLQEDKFYLSSCSHPNTPNRVGGQLIDYWPKNMECIKYSTPDWCPIKNQKDGGTRGTI